MQARRWQDVVDPKIYMQPRLDRDRYQLKVELDPFFQPEPEVTVGPSPKPIDSSWVASTAAPTRVPSASPSSQPSESPTEITAAPTPRYENVDGNGGCQEGTQLFRVNMYDSWGDGWDAATKVTITGIKDQDTMAVSGNTVTRTHTTQTGQTTVSITSTIELTSDHPFGTSPVEDEYTYVNTLGKIFQGTLRKGTHSSAYVCLVPKRCYQVITNGGDYLDEVSWDIEPITLGSANQTDVPVMEGKAPTNCTFSIPDENGESFCASSCTTLEPSETQSAKHLTPVGDTDSSFTIAISTRSADVNEGMKLGQNFLKVMRERGNGS